MSDSETLARQYRKWGPYYDEGGGADAFRYECNDCDLKLVVLADKDPYPANIDFLLDHAELHIIGP